MTRSKHANIKVFGIAHLIICVTPLQSPNDHRLDRRRDLVPESVASCWRARGRTVSAAASRAGLARLVEMQYVTQYPQSERNTLYIITDRGRQALANAPQ